MKDDYFIAIGFTAFFKGAFSGLRRFLTTKSPLKLVKKAFCFTLKSLFVLKIFVLTFWSCRKKGMVKFKIFLISIY